MSKCRKQTAVLQAVRDGAETAREVDAALPDGFLSLKCVTGHLSNLKRAGLIVSVGTRLYWSNNRYGRKRLEVLRYALAPAQERTY